MPTTFVDLFSGAGGLSLGLKRAGWTSLLAVDVWQDALETYAANFEEDHLRSVGHPELIGRGNATMCADLSTDGGRDAVLDRLQGESPDWIVGGPPCKGFSTVGKRQRDDPRNRLVERFADIVEAIRPGNFLIENVLGLRDMNFVGEVVERFNSLGYAVTPAILKAADYGVPQLRRRVIFVGDRTGRHFLKPLPCRDDASYVSVWEAIGDLPELGPGQRATAYDKPPRTPYQTKMRNGTKGLQGHVASRHPPHLVRAISFIPDGGNRRSIPDEYQPSSGFHNSYSRLHSASPAVAVTQNMGKPSGTRCIHPFQHRGLTAREGARLQSFPDWFQFTGGITSQREQVANAVPPVLAQVLGVALMDQAHWVDEATVAVPHNGMDSRGRLVEVDQVPLFAREADAIGYQAATEAQL